MRQKKPKVNFMDKKQQHTKLNNRDFVSVILGVYSGSTYLFPPTLTECQTFEAPFLILLMELFLRYLTVSFRL